MSILLSLSLVFCASPSMQAPGDVDPGAPFMDAPDVSSLYADGRMPAILRRYEVDRRTLRRFYDVSWAPRTRERMASFTRLWRDAIDAMDFEAMEQGDRVDWLLFANRLRYEERRLEREARERSELEPLLPFSTRIAELQLERRALAPAEPESAADALVELREQLETLRDRVRAREDAEDEAQDVTETDDALLVSQADANRAAREVESVRRTLAGWYRFRAGYDPLFSWWVEAPYEALHEALEDYGTFLREEVAGVAEDDTDTIIGEPIGREALLSELEREWIAYTPEELLSIGERELAWCDARMAEASEALGFGEDWRAAQDAVKARHVGPGEQPALIRELALEAVAFLEERELLTVPALAKNSWRMEMMSPERQKFTPYFTGGEVISVAFPTADMDHEDKRMSMRGNNVHFSRATVHHELIPGHHLQQFMNARHATHRRMFSTPFWGEGWALYWEMLLWDEGFPRSPEDRIGMLFWRKHRCARILFSLNYHLGNWTPSECIDFLVERVGHEVRNATAEVRRSVQGGYGPLYQAAYMLGGLQFRALHRETVGAGDRTNRALHDSILREHSIPVEMVRALVTDAPLTRETRASWRFYGE